MARRLARIFTTLALVVGLGAGVSSGPASASSSVPAAPRTAADLITSDWWW